MAEHILNRSLTIDVPIDQVFAFFADAGNLESLTPPELGFNIVTPRPIEMGKGTLIDYTISLRGLPMKWRTEITEWDPPNGFVDMQLRGPYSQWIHSHRFTPVSPGQTLIEDEVRYRLPFEPFGDLVHFLVENELNKIFEFRRTAVLELFKDKAQVGHSPQ
jgi:ligand-binding SRPBCC domain-containing protein